MAASAKPASTVVALTMSVACATFWVLALSSCSAFVTAISARAVACSVVASVCSEFVTASVATVRSLDVTATFCSACARLVA